MDGEDVFGCKIKVQCVDAALTASPIGGGSPRLTANGGGSIPRKPRRDRTAKSPHGCSASASNDSGVKLCSSDDNDGVGEDSDPAARAHARTERRPFNDEGHVDSISSSVPLNGDDIVVCGPVEEIDVDMEMPTKDVNTQDTLPTSVACDAMTTPSKKTKKKKCQCASKPCKLTVRVIYMLIFHC